MLVASLKVDILKTDKPQLYNSLADTSEVKLTLIMPVHFEGVNIIPTIATLAYTTLVPLEILIIYDEENDPTFAVVSRMQSVFPNLVLVKNKYKKAIGAIKTGIEINTTDVVGIWVSYHVDPHGLLNSMYNLCMNDCWLVSGNRFNKVQRVSRGNILKKLLSRTGNYILNRVIGMPIGDITTSIKMYNIKFLLQNQIETSNSGGWSLSTEMAVKACIKGVKIGEVEFGPENTNIISGVTNFKVFAQLDQYLKWLWLGLKNSKTIKANYKNTNKVMHID